MRLIWMRRRVRASLAFVLAAMVFASVAPSAQALDELRYGGQNLPPGWQTQAPFGYGYDITGNIAAYLGSGSVSVCQATLDGTAGVWRTGCAINAVGNAYNLTPYAGHDLWPHVRNNSASRHTIWGWMYGNW